MGLLEATYIIDNGDFSRRVRAAIVQASIDVSAEDPGTVNHTARLTLASKILNNPESYEDLIGLGVALNATIQTDYPSPDYNLAPENVGQVDNDIQFVVNSLFNAYT